MIFKVVSDGRQGKQVLFEYKWESKRHEFISCMSICKLLYFISEEKQANKIYEKCLEGQMELENINIANFRNAKLILTPEVQQSEIKRIKNEFIKNDINDFIIFINKRFYSIS